MNRELQTVQAALKPILTHVYHVEAGVTIRRLYQNLDRRGLALLTMGGASGQTIAGAIATGTHGGDKGLPPLADSVLAMHLVGTGGQQYWIEPTEGITDETKLRAHVAPGVDPQNVIYDDNVFNACLVSLGVMGIVYSVVLGVRERYDLDEKTRETTWTHLKTGGLVSVLSDPSIRFVQVLVSPYQDERGENICLLTTRVEAGPSGPVERPRGDTATVIREKVVHRLDPITIAAIGLDCVVLDERSSDEDKLAKIANYAVASPLNRQVLRSSYPHLLRTVWPVGTLRGSSASIMDIGFGRPSRTEQRGRSFELTFPAIDADGRFAYVDYIDRLIHAVQAATTTFFAGYVSVRFSGHTRSFLGMQQSPENCSVEVSTVTPVAGLDDLFEELYRLGREEGGLPHWGQELDFADIKGHAQMYANFQAWRKVYGKFSADFSARTFENDLSFRWGLTSPV